jgi:hypothetical protein
MVQYGSLCSIYVDLIMSYVFDVYPELKPVKNTRQYTKTVPFLEKLYNALHSLNRKLVSQAWSTPETHVLKDVRIKTHNPFVNTCSMAFAFHLPLKLRVQHFWMAFVQALAIHVDVHSEKLRHKFVDFNGKKKLVLDVSNKVLGGMDQEAWVEVIEEFVKSISEHTKKGVVEDLACDFSDTTSTEHVASLVAIMDVVKKYFDYSCLTLCGFPKITMEGTLEDWKRLRSKILKVVAKYCPGQFGQRWAAKLEPILDSLVDARDESTCVNVQFWDSMIKFGGEEESGTSPWITGWINVFFPYDKFKHVVRDQIELTNFSNGRSSVDVDLDGTPMKLESGFCGVQCDPDTHEVTPLVGWFVCTKSQKEYVGTTIGVNIELYTKSTKWKLINELDQKEEATLAPLPPLKGIRVWGISHTQEKK